MGVACIFFILVMRSNQEDGMKLKGYEQMKFYTRKEFHKKYPKGAGGYTVIGAVGKGVGKRQAPKTILVNGESVEYYPYRAPGFFQEIYGYLKADDHTNEYIAVIRSRAWKIYLLFLLFLAVLFAAVYVFSQTPAGVQLDPNSGKYKAPLELPENADNTHISLPGYSRVYMYEDDDAVELTLWNPESNPCYFVYSIRMQETGEVMYESGYIAPGDAVSEVHLDRTLNEGVYPIVISIKTYDLNNYEQSMNGGEMDANLVVRKR